MPTLIWQDTMPRFLVHYAGYGKSGEIPDIARSKRFIQECRQEEGSTKAGNCRPSNHAEQRELKSLTVIGTGKLVAYSLSCPGSVFFGWVLCSIKICSVRLAVWSVRASRRSQWVPIIFLKIKTVVRAFVSMCIFRDLSQGKYTWKAKLERPWLKGFDLPLIIGTH